MERTRVIIADDESLIRMDLREMLTNLGYLVVGEAGDGRSAVNLARELRPDIVIMDIKMPDMDGIEAAQDPDRGADRARAAARAPTASRNWCSGRARQASPAISSSPSARAT